MGLRERKKEQTRHLIGDTAWRLVADRGFDGVTVAEIAAQAQVAEATVFNYFRTKEDIFYYRLEAFGDRLVAAVGARAAGEPVLAAFRAQLVDSGGLLGAVSAGDEDAIRQLRTVSRVIDASPALRAREREAIARYTDALAEMLLAEAGDPHGEVAAQVTAHALMGVHVALIMYVRHRVLAGGDLTGLADDVRQQCLDAVALLERGLAVYGRPAGT